ncbi:hypothetical protein [Luteolibacter sp. Populi]|uniref:hypothetical protein n=1 Tax=Luteolibacter sp. Populi TaxID=3230487 RepID=UPI003466B1C5
MKTVALGGPDAGELALVVFGAQAAGDRTEPFWLLRRHAEASVYLGALLDATGSIHELLEIWVQRIEGFMASQPVLAKTWTNADLDKRWLELREEIARADGMATLRLGIEQRPAAPLILDIALKPTGETWELCRDDEILKAKGLSAYSGSLHRYLWNRADDLWSVAGTSTPAGEIVRPFTEALPGRRSFNPEGGKIFCRPAGVIGWREFAAILRGGVWNPGVPEEWLAVLPGVHGELAKERGSDVAWRHFLLPAMGEEAGDAEVTYLRLALLYGAVEAVAKATARRGSPFLNLSDEHFGIRLGEGGLGLPALWSARVVLNRGGGAVVVTSEKGGKHFLPDVTATPGPFRIAGPVDSRRLTGSLRIRKVAEVVGGRANVEATLQADDLLDGQEGYRLEIVLETGAGTRVLPGEMTAGGSPREWLFAGSASAEGKEELVEGAAYPKVEVLLHPKLGSACDLYALGILGLQLFLTTEERSLAVVADEILMLRDRLTTGATLPDAAPDWLRQEAGGALQWEALALLLRMLGGTGNGFFKGPGDRLDESPEAIYREPLKLLEDLLRRARASVFGEGGRNQEIRDEIRLLLEELRQGA